MKLKMNALTVLTIALTLGFSHVAEAKTRFLKYRADMGYVKGRTFDVPGRGKIDFAEVINLQFPSLVEEQNVFHLMNVVPHGGTSGIMSILAGFEPLAGQDVTGPAPFCVKDYPQILLSGDVMGYEMRSSFGIKIGYSPDGNLGPVTDLSVKLKIDTAQLDMQLGASHPLRGVVEASKVVGANDTKTTIGAEIDFSKVTIGPEFFFQSKLIDVTAKAISTSLKAIAEKYLNDFSATTDSREPVEKLWFTQVYRVEKLPSGRKFATIFGDKEQLCIEKGDQFEIFIPTYEWPDNSKPCLGFLKGISRLEPAGTLTITEPPALGFSFGEITDSNSESTIPAGAIVKIKKLANVATSRCQK